MLKTMITALRRTNSKSIILSSPVCPLSTRTTSKMNRSSDTHGHNADVQPCSSRKAASKLFDTASSYLRTLRNDFRDTYWLHQQKQKRPRLRMEASYRHLSKKCVPNSSTPTNSSKVESATRYAAAETDAVSLELDTTWSEIVIQAGLIAQARRRQPTHISSRSLDLPEPSSCPQTNIDADVLDYLIHEFQRRSNDRLTVDGVVLVRIARAALYELPADAGRELVMGDEEEAELMERRVLLALQKMRRMVRDGRATT